MTFEKVSSNKVFSGLLTKYKFNSSVLGGLDAQLNLFLPSTATSSKPVPILYYLSGLTCTEDNGAQKGGMFQAAEKEGIALVFPDTSPRGAKIEGEDESYDFGSGQYNLRLSYWNLDLQLEMDERESYRREIGRVEL